MLKVWLYSCLISCGLLLVVFGIVLHVHFPTIMSKQLEKKLIIREDSPTLGNFISPPVPIYMQYYFFNITNTEEILQGAKPKLDQIGPYTYLEKRKKYNLTWMTSTVEYYENTQFFFDQSMSGNLRESDIITTLNPLLITLASKLDSEGISIATLGLFSVYKMRFDLSPFISKRAGELLFKGYKEDLLLELAKATNDPVHKTGRFGFFYPKNDTHGGKYSVQTGVDGLETIRLITSWKDQPNLDYWPESQCNMINGTGGSQFPQPVVPEKDIFLFTADLCRSMHLSFEKQYTFGGLELLRYTLPFEVLAVSEENKCFCSDSFTCRSSMVNLSPCRNGAPVIASTPHFFMGDSETVEAVEGLNPIKEHHETYIDVEPTTGVAFAAMKRIQLSMPLKRYKALPELSNIQEVIIPLLWLNESVKVPEEKAIKLHTMLTKPVQYALYVCIALICIGIVLILLFAFLLKRSKDEQNKTKANIEKVSASSVNNDKSLEQPLKSEEANMEL